MAADVVFSSPPTIDPAATQQGSKQAGEKMSVSHPDQAGSDSDSRSDAHPETDGSPPQLSPHDSADFLLHPVEVAKGRRAAENYLSSFRSDESREIAEEALETLATVISGGKCDSLAFPWQQVRPYHGAAALTILKEKGAPARIEALRCRRDITRSYRMTPESFAPRQVQKIRSTLTKVIEECCELGFVPDESGETDAPVTRRAPRKNLRKKKVATRGRGRILGTGELRALMAACASHQNAEGLRDAVFFSLVYRGLKIVEITALGLDSARANARTGRCTIVAKARSGGRGRRIELSNEELIYLEDWLDFRGDAEGPLLCTLGREGKIEGKRLTTALLKQICEGRGAEAAVAPFTPADLSQSAEALTQHRKKTARKKASRQSQDAPTAIDALLFEDVDVEQDPIDQTIRFPFLGLGI